LAIGAAIGVAVTAAIAFAIIGLQNSSQNTLASSEIYQDNVGSFVYGIAKEISESRLVIDQTFNRTGFKSNPAVVINTEAGSTYFDCFEIPNEDSFGCNQTTHDKLTTGIHVCAHVFSEKDGSLRGASIFYNATCTYMPPPTT
jgi:hypothetical protein